MTTETEKADEGQIVVVTDVSRGDLVYVTGWGDEAFRVEGVRSQRNGNGQWVDLVDVRSL